MFRGLKPILNSLKVWIESFKSMGTVLKTMKRRNWLRSLKASETMNELAFQVSGAFQTCYLYWESEISALKNWKSLKHELWSEKLQVFRWKLSCITHLSVSRSFSIPFLQKAGLLYMLPNSLQRHPSPFRNNSIPSQNLICIHSTSFRFEHRLICHRPCLLIASRCSLLTHVHVSFWFSTKSRKSNNKLRVVTTNKSQYSISPRFSSAITDPPRLPLGTIPRLLLNFYRQLWHFYTDFLVMILGISGFTSSRFCWILWFCGIWSLKKQSEESGKY